ncbi:MAG: histone deacetylase family protein [Candidatus Fonsibacter ubiquis]|nr:histone deacetylase family protein [Pseudomonadota bacterium]NCU51911.1 histone deacetylase family protein [Candidatus Fonsibacter ubiquis]NCU53885.1 histone deacetylase family protein [Candidatus Fonsibacter ubiquis]NCU64024.1 histone deacetylase family protein [Candidatus Fonsibacter ubiquis]NDB37976.1 histone deacetylase family protein [Pseudomonadota bacterium]
MTTCIFTSNSSIKHDTGPGHPECPERIPAILTGLKKIQSQKLIWREIGSFDEKYIELTHSKKYLEKINQSFPKEDLVFLDGDTIVSKGSKKAAYDAVGAIINAIDAVMNQEFDNAFCVVRPPGHHAEKEQAMGFCIFNNVAVGATYLLEKYKLDKVAIIDFDVHHGNGTQDIFYNEKKVLYISSHQFPFYPGTGSKDEIGKFNNILNIPLKAGTVSEEFFNSYKKVYDKLNEFRPQFILLSAGFDAHKNDPLANVDLESRDYYILTKEIMKIAKKICSNKIVSILEGGYNLSAIQESAKYHVEALLEV